MNKSKVTIYNSYYNFDLDADIYQKTIIENVNVSDIQANTRNNTNITSDDRVKVTIFKNKYKASREYVSPVKFKQLDNKDSCFTIQTGDIVIQGEGEDIKFVKDLKDKYGVECYEVTSVDDKVMGRNHLHHWLVMCR